MSDGREELDGGRDTVKVPERRNDRWTMQEKTRFLDTLAATGNVSLAARTIGRTSQGAHTFRRRNADFAGDWRVAVDTACEALQAAVIEHALATGNVVDICPTCGMRADQPFDPALAMQVLSHHQKMAGGAVKAPLSNHRPVPMAEVEAALTRRIAAIVRARKPA